MHYSEIFTIWCRETQFRLTRSQIETDSPNYFTTAFLDGGFNEQTTRTIKLDKHPQLFALILEHLSGYTILPLQPSVLPRYMSVETAKENLWRDAQYFGLDSLCKELKPPLSQMDVPPALSGGYEGIVDFSRLQNKDGGLVLSLEGESYYHIEGIDGLPLFRAQDIPVRLCLQEVEDGVHAQASTTLFAFVDWPNQVRLIQTDQGQGCITRGDPTMVLDNTCSLNINGQAVSPRTMETFMTNWSFGTPPLDLPQHAVTNQPLTESEIYDINFNQPDNLFPLMELVAEELVFSLDRCGTSNPDPGQPIPLFRVGWRYGKLRLREEWASAKWETIIESLNPP